MSISSTHYLAPAVMHELYTYLRKYEIKVHELPVNPYHAAFSVAEQDFDAAKAIDKALGSLHKQLEGRTNLWWRTCPRIESEEDIATCSIRHMVFFRGVCW